MAKSPSKKPSTTIPKPVASPAAPLVAHPSHEEIQARAYALYLARGRALGRPIDDWLEAERQLRGSA